MYNKKDGEESPGKLDGSKEADLTTLSIDRETFASRPPEKVSFRGSAGAAIFNS